MPRLNQNLLIVLCCLALMPYSIAQNVGIGTSSPASKLHLVGDPDNPEAVLRVEGVHDNLADVRGIQASSIIADGWGIGAEFQGGFHGLRSYAYGGSYPGTCSGISGFAYGSNGSRIGLYGYASGGSENWAGYFEGRGRFTQDLHVNQKLFVDQDLFGYQNVHVSDTLYSMDIQSPGVNNSMRIESKRDLFLKIDQFNDAMYTGALFIQDGSGTNAFAVDENGNARTFGHHFVDLNLGIGTQNPASRLHVQNGDLRIQGIAPFQVINTTLPTTPCGIQFRENNNTEGGLYYDAAQNTLNLTTAFFNDGLVLDLDDNSVRIGGVAGATGYKLSVDGKIMGEELRIMNSANWPDYVFSEDYDLLPLDQLEVVIAKSGHLPDIPSATEIEAEGIPVGMMQKRLLQKIEELTLYILEQEQRIKSLEAKIK